MQDLVETPTILLEKQRIQCDGCSARAAFSVDLPYGTLTFCYHHYNSNADALTKQGGIAKLLDI